MLNDCENVRNHLLSNAARYVAFNFARVLVKFRCDAISNAGAAIRTITRFALGFRRACHMRHLDRCERIFAKPSRPGRRKQPEYAILARECASGSPPFHIWRDAPVRRHIEIYQPAEKGAKKLNVRHETDTLQFTLYYAMSGRDGAV